MTGTIGSRLTQFRESLGLEQRVFAERIGVAYRTYQGYEGDETQPKVSALQQLAELGCDIGWLIADRPSGVFQSQSFNSAREISLPRYNAVLSAGPGFSEPDDESEVQLTVSEDFVRSVLRRSPQGLVVAQAAGHSMAPTVNDGELLVVDTADQRLQTGKIYALSVDGNLFVKRISRSIKGQVLLVSDNKDYETEPLPDDVDVRIIGQVIWHGGSLE